MMRFMGNQTIDRKLRLFACACCRRIWHLLPHDANRELVAAVEDHPTGTFDEPELNAAIVASSKVEDVCRDDKGYWAVKYLGRTFYKLRASDSDAVAILAAQRVAAKGGDLAAELSAQSTLRDDIFGNPYPAIRIDPALLRWNGGLVQNLAQSIYDNRSFDRLPILADALERAGYTNTDLLTHCRDLGPHVRGCWVIDLLLGNE
jgi:hypothetical protein